MAIVDEWLAMPNVRIIEPTPGHWSIMREILRTSEIRGPLVTDADIAALAIEHDATVFTADRDFRRFHGARVMNPLAS